MSTIVEQAVEFYNKACLAEEQGEMNLSEVYYLKSAYAFEQAGGTHMLNAANAFNSLAFLRESCGNQASALCAAKKSAQIMEKYRAQSASPDVELIRMTAWELINDLIGYEMRSRSLIPNAG